MAIPTIWRPWRSLQYGVNGAPYNMASMALLTIWRQWRSLQYGVNGPSRGVETPRSESHVRLRRACGPPPAHVGFRLVARRKMEIWKMGKWKNGKWKNGKKNFLWDFGKWEFFGFFGKWKNGKWDSFEIFFVGLFIFWKWKNGELIKKRISKFPGSENEVAEKCNKKLSGENLRAAGGFCLD